MEILKKLRKKPVHSSEIMLRGYLKLKKIFNRRGEYIFLSCMPKTGSTFLKKTLLEITGYMNFGLTYRYERNEQELYLPKIIDAYSYDTITQQHVKATGPNIILLQEFNIKPIVLVRNLFDVIVSIRDYLFKEGFENFPSLYVTEEFANFSKYDQYQFLILFTMPWYLNYFASWFDACRLGKVNAFFITYEELNLDWMKGIKKVLEFYSISADLDVIENSIDKVSQKKRSEIRLNKGIIGRGQSELTESQKELIKNMSLYYPWVDFSMIGL